MFRSKEEGVPVKKLTLKLTLTVALILFSLCVYAGGGESAEHGKYWNYVDMFWRLTNFSVVVGFVIWLLQKVIAGMLDGYILKVKDVLHDAESSQAKAASDLAEYKSKMEKLAVSAEELRATALAEIEAEKKRYLQEAEEQASNLRSSIDSAISSEASAIRNKLVKEFYLKALDVAVKEVQAKLQGEELKKYTKKMLDNIG